MITAEMYNVRPALFITREWRTRPVTYTTETVGYVVEETRVADLAAAKAFSVEKKRELAEYKQREKALIAANMDKYKGLCAGSKDYYSIVTSMVSTMQIGTR